MIRQDELYDLIHQNVSTFNRAFGTLGYDAVAEFYAHGDWAIEVSLHEHRIAVAYDDLDEFERIVREVDEGKYEDAAMEATA